MSVAEVAAAARGRAVALAVALVADRMLGEPRIYHPVAGFGRAMEALERRSWADDRGAGARHLVVGAGAAAAAGLAASAAAGPVPALAAAGWSCIAGRALADAALEIADALDAGDLNRARSLLPILVGRSPEGLDEKEVARAVVESVAENASDAVVASAWWGLAAGAPGVLVHRAVNTLDAMVGHRSSRYERFGWASARADDVLGWPAARLTALLVAVVAPRRALEVWRFARRDARAHPSPNAGVAEAAFAAALGLRLGGVNRYGERGERVEIRAQLGNGRPPEPADIRAAVDLAGRITAALLVLLAVVALVARRVPAGTPPRGRPPGGSRHVRRREAP